MLVLLLVLLLLLLQLVLLLQCRVEHAVHFFERLGSIILLLRSCESFPLPGQDPFLSRLHARCLHRCFSYSDCSKLQENFLTFDICEQVAVVAAMA